MSFKEMCIAAVLVFVAVMGVVVVKTISPDALTLIIGIIIGVAVTGLLAGGIVFLLNRQIRQLQEQLAQGQQRQQGTYPPVVVIQGGGMQPQLGPPGWGQQGYWPAPNAGPLVQRQFHVVGGGELDRWGEEQ
jgi:hypothetical protein